MMQIRGTWCRKAPGLSWVPRDRPLPCALGAGLCFLLTTSWGGCTSTWWGRRPSVRAEAVCPPVTASEEQSWDSNPALIPSLYFFPRLASPETLATFKQMDIWFIYSPVINEANQSGKFRKLFSKEVILPFLTLKFIFPIGQWYFQLSRGNRM